MSNNCFTFLILNAKVIENDFIVQDISVSSAFIIRTIYMNNHAIFFCQMKI